MAATSFSPLITSLLDTDAYKLHMQQAVFRQKLNVPASFEFINRNTDDHLGRYAQEVQDHVNALAGVFLTDEEYVYLKSLPFFKEDYLNYLRSYRFNPSQVEIFTIPSKNLGSDATSASNPYGEDQTDLVIRVAGPWEETILWEVPLLAILSELVQRHRHPNVGVPEALDHLSKKLDEFDQMRSDADFDAFRVCDFGTRRRFSQKVQEAVVQMLSADPRFCSYFCGTSNYDIARRLGLRPIGTQAHEWFQAFQQLAPSLRDSQRCALDAWLREYPGVLGIALTDCITTDAFLVDFVEQYATAFTGLRHDSGDPVSWGIKALAHYRKLGIDTKTKTLVFSDGLSLPRAVELYKVFHSEISVLFGIGTQLSCSIVGVRPLNVVIKMIRCCNSPVAKVSDEPGKTCCDDPEFVREIKRTFFLSG